MAKLVCVEDYRQDSVNYLQPSVYSYVTGGADEEVTLQDNVNAFHRIKLRPRVLRDVSHRDLSTSLLGERVDMPICIAPFGFQAAVHREGESGCCKAAGALKTCYCMSTFSTTRMDEVASSSPKPLLWFQLYTFTKKLTKLLVTKAEEMGFKALVLTVDVAVAGNRRPSTKRPLRLDPSVQLRLIDIPKEEGQNKRGVPMIGAIDPGFSWADLAWLKSYTRLPIVVKGIQSPADAVKAVEYGAAAVYVSNHGGRQLDTVPAAIEVLPDIVRAVGDKVEVYVDGGVRTGTDVLKALALGATAVFVGRPAIWGLACAGGAGVESVLNILKEEFSTAMALSGCSKVKDIDSSLIWKGNQSRL